MKEAEEPINCNEWANNARKLEQKIKELREARDKYRSEYLKADKRLAEKDNIINIIRDQFNKKIDEKDKIISGLQNEIFEMKYDMDRLKADGRNRCG